MRDRMCTEVRSIWIIIIPSIFLFFFGSNVKDNVLGISCVCVVLCFPTLSVRRHRVDSTIIVWVNRPCNLYGFSSKHRDTLTFKSHDAERWSILNYLNFDVSTKITCDFLAWAHVMSDLDRSYWNIHNQFSSFHRNMCSNQWEIDLTAKLF